MHFQLYLQWVDCCAGQSEELVNNAKPRSSSNHFETAVFIRAEAVSTVCRTLTCTWIGILWGIMFYNTPADNLTGLRNRMNLTFAMLQTCILLPFVSISLYTADKRFYLADASAKLYRASSYYAAKVRNTGILVAFCLPGTSS